MPVVNMWCAQTPKLMNPVAGPALVVGSYTHPEYAESMTATFRLMGTHAMLLRGSSSAARSNAALVSALRAALVAEGLATEGSAAAGSSA